MYLMYLMNRVAFALKPKRPFVDWVNSLTSVRERNSVSQHYTSDTVYLIDVANCKEEIASAISERFSSAFEHELAEWCPDRDVWPQTRNLQTFKNWFEIEYFPMVVDLSELDVEVEEFGIYSPSLRLT